ncbi:MAG: hypothetical protein ACK40O_12790, partial [Allosphingosinicella sp.]
LTPGKHYVTFRHPSAPDEPRTIKVGPGQTVFLDVSMRIDRGDAGAPPVLAYRIGRDEAVDRILLGDDDPAAAATLSGWERPRLKLGGGDLIAMGLEPGPVVARTFQAVEREWSERGFPADAATQRAIAERHVRATLA